MKHAQSCTLRLTNEGAKIDPNSFWYTMQPGYELVFYTRYSVHEKQNPRMCST